MGGCSGQPWRETVRQSAGGGVQGGHRACRTWSSSLQEAVPEQEEAVTPLATDRRRRGSAEWGLVPRRFGRTLLRGEGTDVAEPSVAVLAGQNEHEEGGGLMVNLTWIARVAGVLACMLPLTAAGPAAASSLPLVSPNSRAAPAPRGLRLRSPCCARSPACAPFEPASAPEYHPALTLPASPTPPATLPPPDPARGSASPP